MRRRRKVKWKLKRWRERSSSFNVGWNNVKSYVYINKPKRLPAVLCCEVHNFLSVSLHFLDSVVYTFLLDIFNESNEKETS